ncbi:MAG: right-handed parallel beta-helix repeat-containing protein, partial [Planctomycetes bacterium]|nr:right-handed parallel beta-helix repeat-containing protein [Planctomycetota bacterium]
MASRNKTVAVLFACALSTAVARAQTTYFVDGSCGDDAWTASSPICEAPNGPKRTIQAGIDASVTGDTVIVADGVYTGFGNRDLDFGGRDIHLRSESLNPALCIIDCQGTANDPHRGFYFHSGETTAAIVEGFTITNGYANFNDPGRGIVGGGVFCEDSSPTFRKCAIVNNTAQNSGGGVWGHVPPTPGTPVLLECVVRGNQAIGGEGGGINCPLGATLIDCEIIDNNAQSDGGALVGLATVSGCTISGNTSNGFAAGIRIAGGTLSDCWIFDNHATRKGQGGGINASNCVIENSVIEGNSGGLVGGGIDAGRNVTVVNCTIRGNSAVAGGGIHVLGQNVLIKDCLIESNHASGFNDGEAGGGLALRTSGATVLNCIVAFNTSARDGGGIWCSRDPIVVNCLIVDNVADGDGGGIRTSDGIPLIANCTVAFNHAAGRGGGIVAKNVFSNGLGPTVYNSIIWGNSAVAGPQLAVLDYVDGSGFTWSVAMSVGYNDAQGGKASVVVDPLSTLNWLAGNFEQ